MTDHVPAVDESAPVVTLSSTLGKPLELAGYYGQDNFLLAYVPHAFSTVGTAEMCAFRDRRASA